MHLKNKWKYYLLILFCVACITCVILMNIKKEETQDNVKMIELDNFNLKDRMKLKTGETIYIGENLKELENKFYDLKISTLNNTITLTLNKLWRYKCNEQYIEDDYLIEIVEEVVKLLDVENIKEDVEYELYKYIKQNFLKVKSGKDVSNLELESIKLTSESIEGECVIHITKVSE